MKARVIALYLPQFHPIPENDEWWGKGFTEWTNVAKTKPLFKGHYQPKVPADLGFYDLRMPEVRQQQAELAKEAGIEGFCYWHYWFGNGKRLLERPFNEVLQSGNPDFPFCLAWANHTWSSKTWNKEKRENTPLILQEQLYPGIEDYTNHFYALLPAFRDSRYIKVDGKPFFMIYDPLNFEDVSTFINCWRKLAVENGLEGIHFVAHISSAVFRLSKKESVGKVNFNAEKIFNYVLAKGFDAVNSNGQTRANIKSRGIVKTYLVGFFKRIFKLNIPERVEQRIINKYLFCKEEEKENVYPTLVPNYDRAPRTNKDVFYHNSTPGVFKDQINRCLSLIKSKSDQHKIVILKSWNEWGEGNYVEPCIKYGKGYLNAIKELIYE